MSDPRPVTSWFQYLHLANAVLFGNIIAGVIGDYMGTILFQHRYIREVEPDPQLLQFFYNYLSYGALGVTIAFTLWYERPVRNCLKQYHRGRIPHVDLLARARKRVLNEPYVITLVEALIWGSSSLLFWALGSRTALVIGMGCGMITVVLAFFWMEHMNQHHLIPVFFPKGRPSEVKGAVHIGIWGRFAALIFAVAIVPFSFIQLTIFRYRQLWQDADIDRLTLMDSFARAITSETLTFLFTAMGLSWLMAANLRQPLREIIRVLEAVKKGNFRERAQVFSTDEIGFAGESLNTMCHGLAERELIKDSFGKYVDHRIRDEILAGRIPLDGEIKQATILFADLRNFTPLVAVSDPKELIHVLNAYFNEMAQAVTTHGGLILQFIGDEVEAVFGAPVPSSNHETAAVQCALEMQDRLMTLNARLANQGRPELKHGIGIHTGQVLAATIGSDQRSAYSLIGDTVNLASRIQGLNKRFNTQILVSEKVAAAAGSVAALTPMPRVTVKGKPDPIRVFAVATPDSTL